VSEFSCVLFELFLELFDLGGHSHNYVDAGEIDTEVVDEAGNGAEALDILV